MTEEEYNKMIEERIERTKPKMIIEGKYMNCKVFCDDIEEYTIAQAKQLCDQKCFEGGKMALMPDAHPGKPAPIGTVIAVPYDKKTTRIMPMLIGNDIGCGITTYMIDAEEYEKKISFEKLDSIIKRYIPTGDSILSDSLYKKTMYRHNPDIDELYESLYCKDAINYDKFIKSQGTLGGGNHFIEIDKMDYFKHYCLSIHSGSRSIGAMVNFLYLEKARKYNDKSVPYELLTLNPKDSYEYQHDAIICTRYASSNRICILQNILKELKIEIQDEHLYDSCHNSVNAYMSNDKQLYIMYNKGSIPLYTVHDDAFMVPINMKEGMIVCVAFGNEGDGSSEWLWSAPHGSGRIMNRSEVKNHFTFSQYKKEMKGIHSPTIDKSNLDEAPFAYRGMETIKEQLIGGAGDIAIVDTARPVYVYKHSDNLVQKEISNKKKRK